MGRKSMGAIVGSGYPARREARPSRRRGRPPLGGARTGVHEADRDAHDERRHVDRVRPLPAGWDGACGRLARRDAPARPRRLEGGHGAALADPGRPRLRGARVLRARLGHLDGQPRAGRPERGLGRARDGRLLRRAAAGARAPDRRLGRLLRRWRDLERARRRAAVPRCGRRCHVDRPLLGAVAAERGEVGDRARLREVGRGALTVDRGRRERRGALDEPRADQGDRRPALVADEAAERRHARLHVPGPRRLRVRRYAGGERLRAPARAGAPLPRPVRTPPVELLDARHRLHAIADGRVVRPLPQGRAERDRQDEARHDRRRDRLEAHVVRGHPEDEDDHHRLPRDDARAARRPEVRTGARDVRRLRAAGAGAQGAELPAARRDGARRQPRDHSRRDCAEGRVADDQARELRAVPAEGHTTQRLLRRQLRRRHRISRLRGHGLDLARPGEPVAAGADEAGQRMKLLLAVLALAACPVALAAATPGVTSTTITIGGTVPITGPAALFGSVGRGADAYFKYVNAHGGVNGRKIKYVYRDDAYDPAKTVQLTRELVENDHVFAIFNSVGTDNTVATTDYLNAAKVPQLFAGTGTARIGDNFKSHPWTMGYLPSFRAEGLIYGHAIAKIAGAKVAVLAEATDFGKDLTDGLKKGLGAKSSAIVSTQQYQPTDTSIESQMSTLHASGANVLVLNVTPQYAILAYLAAHKLGWRPRIYLSSVCISPNVMDIVRASVGAEVNGSQSIAFVKDPTDRTFAKDPAVTLYKSILEKYAPGAKPSDVYNFYGMGVAYTMVDALKHAGKSPTRASLLEAAQHLNEVNPFMRAGVKIATSPTDYYPISKAQLVRYDRVHWVAVGPLVSARD